jgi:hypothetical protein
MGKCNVKKLSNGDVKQCLQISIRNVFISVENVEKNCTVVMVMNVWEYVRDSEKILAYKSLGCTEYIVV